jgi:SAM-dependent methyltransferase
VKFVKNLFKTEKPNREWSRGVSQTVKNLVQILKKRRMTQLILDLGAGEGRHSVYALEAGIDKVIAIEIDKEQTQILKTKGQDYSNLKVVGGDVLEYLPCLKTNNVSGVFDIGMSHCLEKQQKQKLVNTVHEKLREQGLYAIVHFSEKETLAPGGTNLEDLKDLFPIEKWKELKSWKRISWKRFDGKKHFAYTAILEKI